MLRLARNSQKQSRTNEWMMELHEYMRQEKMLTFQSSSISRNQDQDPVLKRYSVMYDVLRQLQKKLPKNKSLLLTLSVSHSPTLCQTTTPPSKTPTPRSAQWMEKRPGWTVRLTHTGHEFTTQQFVSVLERGV